MQSSHLSNQQTIRAELFMLFVLNLLISCIYKLKSISFVVLVLSVFITIYATFFGSDELTSQAYIALYISLASWIVTTAIFLITKHGTALLK